MYPVPCRRTLAASNSLVARLDQSGLSAHSQRGLRLKPVVFERLHPNRTAFVASYNDARQRSFRGKVNAVGHRQDAGEYNPILGAPEIRADPISDEISIGLSTESVFGVI